MVDLYPVPIQIIPSVRPVPQIVPLSTVRRWARVTGNPNAHRMDMAGITVPGIRPDTRTIQFARRFQEGGRQFRYRTGALTIRIWSHIYLSDRLRECERRVWAAHEMDHVQDYEQVGATLMLRLQHNPFMREFFVDQTWYPESEESIGTLAQRFETECARLFQQFTAEAAVRRDSPAGYERVRARIREACSGRIVRPSRRAGDRR